MPVNPSAESVAAKIDEVIRFGLDSTPQITLLFIVPNLHCARKAGFKDGVRHYRMPNARVWWPSLGEPSFLSLPTPALVHVDPATAPSMWNHQDVRKLGRYEEDLAHMRQRWGRDTVWIEP